MNSTTSISLAGSWSCRLDPGHNGLSEGWQERPVEDHTVILPGSTQTNGIGQPYTARLISGLTPETNHVGPAWYRREFEMTAEQCEKHIELYLERCCWQTFAWINGQPLGSQDSLVSPHIYDLSDAVRAGTNQLTVMVDNSNLKSVGDASGGSGPAADGSGHEDLKLDLEDQKRLNCGGHHTVFGGFAWNGMTGALEVRIQEEVRITDLQIYPQVATRSIRVVLTCTNDLEEQCPATISLVVRPGTTETPETQAPPTQAAVSVPPAMETGSAELTSELLPGRHRLTHDMTLGQDAPLWDEFDPALYCLEATLTTSLGVDTKRAEFGLRELSQVGTQLAINGNPTFLRGALENFLHPITGYPPTDLDYWLQVFGVNKAHGLNHVRFHTCCPPEAAFAAADRLGIILNVELPGCSGSEPEDKETLEYLQLEALRILQTFGNHPSFCMLTMGNELLYGGGEEDARTQTVLVQRVAACRDTDPRHWYCCTAHPHTDGRDDDFYVSAWPKGATWEENGEPIVGIRWSGFDVVDSSRFNTRAPETASDYRDGMAGIDKPVITHEVGQWAVYPDINEADRFSGVCKAFNLEIIREFMDQKGTLPRANEFVRASGQLSLLLYKEEIESALRTPGLAGFQILGFHDHPPQGTSTVGIVTALREPKGLITPDEFRGFCGDVVPLARLPKRTYTNDESLVAEIDLAHWGQQELHGAAFRWRLTDPGNSPSDDAAVEGGQSSSVIAREGSAARSRGVFGQRQASRVPALIAEGEFEPTDIGRGQLARIGTITAELSSLPAPTKAVLEVFVPGTEIHNYWDLWVYPAPGKAKAIPIADAAAAPTDVQWVRRWDSDFAQSVEDGATAILELTADQIPHATRGCFTTVFWNPIMKRNQESFTMGILCDPDHPALAAFPTEYHSNWQWWDVLRPSRVLDLDGMQPRPGSIVGMIDSFIGNCELSLVFEARLGKGRILVTSLDLSSDLATRHASRQLRHSLTDHVGSESFDPGVTITAEDMERLLRAHQQKPIKETRDEVKARFDQPV